MAARDDAAKLGVRCSVCGGKTEVLDSRPSSVGGSRAVRRRRKCMSCPYRFSTYEIEEGALLKQLQRLEAIMPKLAVLRESIGTAMEELQKRERSRNGST